ncbi:MarR family transcriptional regulator [Lachnospiraceae bacterium 50-23]|jgi:DNA-binding MarR family transcriptional regulator|nr:MarR family transcriptional regulator [Dorea sp.]
MQERTTIGFMFKQINNVYEKEFNNRLRTLGITSSQCEVLDYLFSSGKEEVTQRDIEKALNLRNPTVTGILKRLDERGFILSIPSNKDRRCKNIYLTEKAYDIRKRMEMDRKKIDKMLTLGMNKKERAALKRMLEKVLYNIAEP